ncbi:MAG: DUF6220 domain-containing protein [Chloroflexota bacterium]
MSNARWARIGFAILAWLFVALTVVQVYLAGVAMAKLGGSDDFGTHQAVGWVIGIIALVQMVLSFAGRLGWRMIGASALLLVLMVLQLVLPHTGTPSLEALHPVTGFLVVLLGLWVAWRGLSFIRAPLPVEPVHVPAGAPVASSEEPAANVENRDDETNP